MKLYQMFTGIMILFLVGCSSEKIISDSDKIGKFTVNMEIVPDFDGNKYSDLRKEALSVFKSRINFIIDPEAELGRLNRDRGPQPMSQDFKELLSLTIDLSEMTNGNWNPYMGKPRDLWQFDASEPTTPSPSFLYNAVEQAHNTEVVLHTGDKAQLTGDGLLYIDYITVGWAIDGAAEVLIGGGVDAGKISVGNLSRFWGSPPDSTWGFLINSPSKDSTSYNISPDDGALRIISLETDGFMHRERLHYTFLNPEDGLLLPEPMGCAVWTPTAAEAAAYVEAIVVMKLSDGFEWANHHEDISALYIFPADGTYAVHMDQRMTPWVKSIIRR